jgi:HK97 family phage prohead protease
MKTKDFPLKVDAVDDAGTFTGYGSIFGNLDSYGEIVEPGAFAKSLARHAREKTSPLMLWQHDSWEPIGVWDELVEDQKGLKGVGRLLKGVQKADEAYIRLKAGAVRGLSIGYREIKVEPEGNNRRLKELDLMEISIVSFPANNRARVDAVKHDSWGRLEEFMRALRDGEPRPIKEFEDLLREAGAPKSMAVAIASSGYAKAIRSESGGKATDEAVAALKGAVAAFLPRT